MAVVLALALVAGLVVTGRVLAERPQAAAPATPAPATAAPGTATPGTPAPSAPAPAPTVPGQPSPVRATIEIGSVPSGMATGGGALWVAGSDHLARIDPATGRVAGTTPVGATGPAGVAFGGGAVWVPVAVPGALWAVDPQTGKVTARIPLGGPLRGPISVTATRGAVWIACYGATGPESTASGGTLLRVDPRRERVVAQIPLPDQPVAVAADASAAWVATADGRVLMVSARRNRVVAAVDAGDPLGFSQPLAVGAGGVWLADPLDEQVVRIDPRTRRVVARIPAGAATTLAATQDAVWVISSLGLLRVDPAENRVVAVASDPELRRARLVAADAHAVWLAGWSSVTRVDPSRVTP